MKKISSRISVFFLLLSSGLLLTAGWFSFSSSEIPEWPESTAVSKPWTRWWWAGNAVDRENISRELKEMAAAGIGGVEITSIYGVNGEEDRFVEYLSPEYSEMLKFTIDEANKLGMGVDLPPGSGWRMGGPFVPEGKGLWSLRMHSFPIEKGEEWKLPPGIGNAELASFVNADENVTLLYAEESFKAPQAGKIYVAERLKNEDKVKRAADGGKGWAIDTFNEDITDWYLHEFWNRLGIDEGLVRSFFHDSFEYTGDFTTDFTEEFKKRRGYDLAEYLHVLAGDSKNPEVAERVRSDYRETLSELVLESFIQPLTRWANSHRSLNRNQAHGSPGNMLDLYAACDIPETEIFGRIEPGTVNIFNNKFASSAAHVTGQKLVAAESFTWLDEHWTVTPADMMRATNRLLLSGVNHMLFHGTCYSPEDAEWPGWLFYASTQINNRNPIWRELPVLFKYIERSQSILQQALPQNDLLVYWPYHDVAATEGSRMFLDLNINTGDEVPWFRNTPLADLSQELMDAGYSFDYISDRQLLNCRIENGEVVTEGNARYRAVVLPKIKFMPVKTLHQLEQFLEEGGKIYFHGALPASVPGIKNLEERQQQLDRINSELNGRMIADNALQLLEKDGISGETSLLENGFHYLKMTLDDEKWYMVVNSSTTVLDEWVVLNAPARSYLLYFPENGNIERAESRNGSLRLQLEPERAVFIRCTNERFGVPAFGYYEESAVSHELEGVWKIRFLEGGPVYPGDVSTDRLVSWTRFGDENTSRFAGTARYSLEFSWDVEAEVGWLNLGEVKDCVRVKLNGKQYGSLLGPAFRVKVDNLVQGKNLLEVEVTNVAANRIRDLDRRGVNWKKFHDINFVNIGYQSFDASGWEVREAGLLGKVEVRVLGR